MLQDIRLGHGVDLAIPGAWHGAAKYDGCRQTLSNARSIGLHTATYVAITSRYSGRRHVEEALGVVGSAEWDKLSFVALDFETDGVTYQHVTDAVDYVILAGQRPIIYTAYWWWSGHFRNPPLPRGIGLWNAYYDNDPDYDFYSLPYGQQQDGTLPPLVGEQYTNTTPIADDILSVDFNRFDDAFVLAKPGSAAGLVALVEAWKKDMRDLTANQEDCIERVFDTTAVALHSLYAQKRSHEWSRLLGK